MPTPPGPRSTAPARPASDTAKKNAAPQAAGPGATPLDLQEAQRAA